jgi:hypothetical protein
MEIPWYHVSFVPFTSDASVRFLHNHTTFIFTCNSMGQLVLVQFFTFRTLNFEHPIISRTHALTILPSITFIRMFL